MAVQRLDLTPTEQLIAENIATLRKRRRYSLRTLAARLSEVGPGLTDSAISQIENGRRRASAGDLWQLALALQVAPAVFYVPLDAEDPQAVVGDMPAGDRARLAFYPPSSEVVPDWVLPAVRESWDTSNAGNAEIRELLREIHAAVVPRTPDNTPNTHTYYEGRIAAPEVTPEALQKISADVVAEILNRQHTGEQTPADESPARGND
ncbi:helix-turn-helix domain-containing protein [Corynebacterium variabile]|uniref:helix-turn-helix domain-containing protein n=1 Tax=Corynebacterium variabile TaxID=1727 RepID=UPI0028AA6887|nr:helix-turn-helix transcriptional regulator [Corynebacterium variabile]